MEPDNWDEQPRRASLLRYMANLVWISSPGSVHLQVATELGRLSSHAHETNLWCTRASWSSRSSSPSLWAKSSRVLWLRSSPTSTPSHLKKRRANFKVTTVQNAVSSLEIKKKWNRTRSGETRSFTTARGPAAEEEDRRIRVVLWAVSAADEYYRKMNALLSYRWGRGRRVYLAASLSEVRFLWASWGVHPRED